MTTRLSLDDDPRAGFTLLELLIAITLLGLLMAALFGGLQLGARAWERGEERLDQSARLQVVQGFLRDRLAQSYPLNVAEEGTRRRRLMFEGTSDALRFVTLMPEHLGTGFAELVLTVDDQDHARHLIVRWRPFDVSKPVPATADVEPQVKVLLEQIEDLRLSYYGAPSRDLPAAWYERWLEASNLPELVRIQVSFSSGDPRHWPDLIVSAMTDAAPLVFEAEHTAGPGGEDERPVTWTATIGLTIFGPGAQCRMSQISALVRRGFNAFFDWWLAELAGVVPPALDPVRRRRRRLLVLALGEKDATLFQGTGANRRLIARSDGPDPEALKPLITESRRRGRHAIVRLPPQHGLNKTIELPLAARNDLDQLLRFEMDRLTPFRAEEVLFAHRLVRTDAQSRRMTVELQLAPKPVVEAALDQARRAGLLPVRVELGDHDPADEHALDLLPNHRVEMAGVSRLNRALALLAVILAAAAVVIPLQERRSTAADLEAQLAAARAEAEESLALRERLERLSASSDFLATQKARLPMASLVLAEVTRVVPDQAYLARLDWRDGTLQLQGFAEAAAALVGLLDRSPMFEAPQFRSPVTPDRRTNLERFHVAVELTPGDG